MREWDGFMKSIVMNPEDISVRLIAADWLDENGQDKRAEFIRNQCGPMRSLIASAEVMSDGWRVHGRNGDAFLAEILEKELSDIETSIGTVVTYRGGFVEAIHCTCADWLEHGPAIVRAAPIREVMLTDARPQDYHNNDYTFREGRSALNAAALAWARSKAWEDER